MRIRPVAAPGVGDHRVEVAGQPPSYEVAEGAGPERGDLVAMARAVARRQHRRVAVLALPVPGAAGRAMRGGGQLPGPGARILGPSFGDWLATTTAAAAGGC